MDHCFLRAKVKGFDERATRYARVTGFPAGIIILGAALLHVPPTSLTARKCSLDLFMTISTAVLDLCGNAPTQFVEKLRWYVDT